MKTEQEYALKEKFAQALDKVSSMRVDDFQIICDDNKLDKNYIDNLVFDVAKIIMEKDNE